MCVILYFYMRDICLLSYILCCLSWPIETKTKFLLVKGFQGTAAESQPQPKPRFSQYSVSSILVVFTLAVLVLVIFLFHGRAKSPYGGDTVEDSSTRSEL